MERPIGILIVDDHEVVRRGLESILQRVRRSERSSGMAASGEEAVTLAASLDCDVVLLDLQLPGMHGLEVIPQLVKDGTGRRRSSC